MLLQPPQRCKDLVLIHPEMLRMGHSCHTVTDLSNEDDHVRFFLGKIRTHLVDVLRKGYAVPENAIRAILDVVRRDEWRAPSNQQLLSHCQAFEFIGNV
eukprot:3642894-Lingulodinium_polyedra.AAC.1